MEQREGASLLDILRIVYRRIRILKVVVVVLPIVTLLVTFIVSPQYRTAAKVLVVAKKENATMLLPPKESGHTSIVNLNVEEADVNSETELLQSRDLWKQTVEKLGIGYFRKQKENGKSFSEWLRDLLGLTSGDSAAAAIADKDAQLDAVVTSLISACKVVPQPKSKVIEIEFTYNNPKKAYKILATQLELYIPYHLQVHSVPGAQGFFLGQGEDYKQKYEEATRRVIDFKKKWGIAYPEKQKEELVRQIAQIEGALVQVSATVKQYGNMLASLQKNEIPTGQASGVIRKGEESTVVNVIAAQLLRAQQKNLEARENFVEKTQDYQATREMVDALTTRLRQALEGELQNLDITKAVLEKDLDRYQKALEQLEEKAEEAKILDIEATVAKDRYVQYATRGEDARVENMMEGKQLVSVRVVSQPFLPESPSFPRKGLLVVTAFILAFPLGLGMILVATFLDRSFDTPQEVEAVTGQKVLASLKRLPKS